MSERGRSAGRRPRARPEPGTLDDARALVLRVLAFHARTRAQLRARLERAGLAAHAEAVLAWAERLGYLDDAAYARGRARALLAAGRSSPRRAEEKLRAEGVDAAAARAAVAEAAEERAAARGAGESAELALAREALHRRLRGRELSALDLRERARLARFLVGRGFSPGAVARLVPLDPDAG